MSLDKFKTFRADWIDDACECDDLYEDLEITETEPTPFNILFNAFSNWHSENYSNGKVDQVKVKKRLIDWQRKSRFGFVEGTNGNERYPKFNLKPVEEC